MFTVNNRLKEYRSKWIDHISKMEEERHLSKFKIIGLWGKGYKSEQVTTPDTREKKKIYFIQWPEYMKRIHINFTNRHSEYYL